MQAEDQHSAGPPARSDKTATAAGLLIVAARPLARDCLAEGLGRDSAFRIVGAVAAVADALAVLRQRSVELVVLDTAGGQDALADASRLVLDAPGQRVVLLDDWADEKRAAAAMDNGLAAYLDWTQTLDELRVALRRVVEGERILTPSLMRAPRPHFRPQPTPRMPLATLASLTPREREILGLMVQGTDIPSVAKQLGLSRSTIEHYRGRLLKRFGFKRFPQLVYWVLTEGEAALRGETPA